MSTDPKLSVEENDAIIAAMPAGSEMDALIAKRFFPHPTIILSYSTDMNAAWQIIDKLVREGWLVQIDNDENYAGLGTWHVDIGGGCAYGETAPLAICRAALMGWVTLP